LLSEAGIPVIGLPKTIDNDLAGTDYTFGFDTAVSIAAEAIDRLRTTGESHHRCMLLEVMGRDVGWIALHAGVAGGAQAMLVPEYPETLEQVCDWVTSVRDRGRSSLVVVAEGFRLVGASEAVTRQGLDGFGRPRLGGISETLAPLIEEATGVETRATVLGYVQRGGSPTAFDRVLATRTGTAAADAALAADWGTLAALRGDRIEMIPLAEIAGRTKRVPEDRYTAARLNFG
jgi:6-phosphofructokinase 1